MAGQVKICMLSLKVQLCELKNKLSVIFGTGLKLRSPVSGCRLPLLQGYIYI